MKNILLPTDFSENAWNAARYAIELFKNENCTFYALNTYTPHIAHSRFMATNVGNGTEEDAAKTVSEKGLTALISRMNTEFNNPKHKFIAISSFSMLVDEIKEAVDDYKIDLVITGTKGSSGVDEVFMGSNTVRIIKTVKRCPVLAVPQNFKFKTPDEIAFATDFNRFYTQSELQPLLDMASTFNAVIRIVHVQHKITALTELQKFNLSMLRKYLKTAEHYVHTVSELNSISKTLEVFSEELDIHLLAMLHYQHSYLESITRESVVKRIAFHTQIPLLVIPELGMSGSAKSKKEQSVYVSE
ncbi:universal stress protein [Zobellia uliginosa]|uniref:universal stress protein n=1 Tax=Zobellia uliginosa TaxID=143224 RepID=UPI001C064E92|nr:universal stress protein [Zobellia uliginosa]MBU2947743.1 universal stress protein [Zobellia uliginosa]